MQYTEVKVIVNTEDTERASAIAVMTVPYGIYIEDYSELEKEAWEIAHIDLIDEDLLKKDRNQSVIHIYIEEGNNPSEAVSFLSERLTAEKIDFTIETDGVSSDDWADKWKAFFKPQPIGDRLFVRPVWVDDYDSGDRVVLNIEPGAAFGTGTHETTRLCLETLDKIIKDGDTVLDIGCGSGILAICSLLLGAKKGVGVDIDAMSVKTAIENAELNGVSGNFEGIVGSLTEKVEGKYDLIAANIVADVLLFLNKDIKQFLKEDGIYIMSGIIDMREQEILDSLEGEFKVLDIRRERG